MHDVFHVSLLRKYIPDSTHVVDLEPLQLQPDLSYEEKPLRIIDTKVKELKTKQIPFVKVVWNHHGTEEATWEVEEKMRMEHSELFQ